ncbi:uncharacterized protein VTP21DRAFT_1389 [Calcarisporiella thermophila]|uniref:uncharacterized protein n=1 Tax=Calcarisporiella thermophila TaxID=911321 RepID=UPI003742FA44
MLRIVQYIPCCESRLHSSGISPFYRSLIHFSQRNAYTSDRKCPVDSFEALGIPNELCNSIRENFGIIKPTTAQRSIIPSILANRDVLIRDQTGTGKSFSILLALLSKQRSHPSRYPLNFSARKNSPRAYISYLVLVPNRELAEQIGIWAREILPKDTYPSIAPILQIVTSELHENRDLEIKEQTAALIRESPHILVGTPKRVHELLLKDALDLQYLRTIVVDEVDQALRLPRRFAREKEVQLRRKNPKPCETVLDMLLGNKPKQKPQLIALSATLNRQLRYFMFKKGWIYRALFIDIAKTSLPPATIKHHCLVISGDTIRNLRSPIELDNHSKDEEMESIEIEKDSVDEEANGPEADDAYMDRMLEGVTTVVEMEDVNRGLVIVPATSSVSRVIDRLSSHGLKASEVLPTLRTKSANKIENQQPNLLIGTEVTTRGIDLPLLSHVFILGAPSSPAAYLHVAGRTGRMGKPGSVFTFIRDQGRKADQLRNMFRLMNVEVQHYEQVQ